MSENQNEKHDPESLMSFWMKSATDFWGSTSRMWPDAGEPFQSEGLKKQFQKLESAPKMWQSFILAFSEPESMSALFKGMDILPEVVLQTLQSEWGGYSGLQKKWMEKASRMGKQSEDYKFEDLDKDIFKVWAEVYEKEFSQFLNIPQIGLTRFYQERVGQTLNRFNLFQIAMSEFISLLYLPVEKSAKDISEKLEEVTKKGDLSENFEEYYREWIKILEGHYMVLFKSTEYIQGLNKVLDAGENYFSARNHLIEDILQLFPVATNKDMDELCKEIYLLKKEVKKLSKKVAGLK
ncbi:MAG: hypothetical protein JRD69_05955 [Deltaproteobacteria bacterium]|nr:hypothetical protein [Deltaproteobacteria bacterium]